MSDESWAWIASKSIKYGSELTEVTLENGTVVQEMDNHGFGHDDGEANLSTVGFLLLSLIILVGSTLYIIIRVHKDKKYFSKDWLR